MTQQLTDTQKLEYIKHNNYECPSCSESCKGENDSQCQGDNTMKFNYECGHCFSKWSKVMTISSVTLKFGGSLKVTKLTPLQAERYIAHGQCCPICQEDGSNDGPGLSSNEPTQESSSAFAEIACYRCGAVWEDRFKLTDVVIETAGRYEKTLERI